MELFIVIVLYTLVIVFDYIPIIKHSNNKNLIILYGAMLTISFIVLVLYCFDITKPIISDFLIRTIEQVFPIK